MINPEEENKENPTLLNHNNSKKQAFSIKHPKSILFRAINTKAKEPQQPPFEIRPSEIVFHNTKENTVYEISFAVRNKTNGKLKIKLAKPLQRNFSLEYEEVEAVAPGLSLKAKMLYTCRKNEEIHSTFKVYTENFKMDVPVSAFPPCPFFIFDPIVDFEFVNMEELAKRDIKIRNEGLKAGEISFKSRDPNVLRIEPRDIYLEAEEEKFVTVIFQPSKLGAYKNIVELEMVGHSIYKAVDFSANVVSNNAYIINKKGEELHSLDFGLNLLGKEVRRKVILVNNSPNELNFGISIIRGFHADDGEKTKLQTPMDMGRELTEKIMTVSPSSGKIKPYEKLNIVLSFNSNIRDEDIVNSQKIAKAGKYIVIEERVFEYTVMFDFNKRIESKCLLVSALTIPPQVTFSRPAIDFGEIELKKKLVQKMTLKNWNSRLPITVEAPNEFYIHVSPRTIHLKPLEEKTIDLIFTPKNMGIINRTVYFSVNRYFRLYIKIFGVGLQPKNSLAKVTSKTKIRNMKFKKKVEMVRQKNFYTEKKDTLRLPKIKTFNYFNKKETTIDKNNVMSRKFVPDPKNAIKELNSKPINNEQDWQCKQKLSGEQLMNIYTGPVELNFGKVFVKSGSSLYFQIRNDLNNPIKARLDISDVYELRESYLKPQIIPSGKMAGFRLTFNCHTTRKFKEKINYVINNQHVFNLMVIAEVIPVDLKINRSRIDFEFSQESLDMNKSESIKLFNNGNSDAKFNVKIKDNSAFSVDHNRGVVPVGKHFTLNVIYTPISDKDNDTIIIDIENGIEKLIECNGCAYETVCELNTNHLNMGTIAIGQSKASNFTLKNQSNKLCAIFKIDKSTIPPHLTLKPLIGKINPEDIQKFEIEFYSKKSIEFKNHEIDISVRGSRKIRLLFSVTTISPEITIEEDLFDFQTITFGSKATLPMTIANHSSISAELYLQLFTKKTDLQEKYDCLDIDYSHKGSSNDSLVFEQVSEQYLKNHKNRSNEVMINTHFNEKDKDKRSYIFYLKPNRSYTYTLVFSPIKPGSYVFNLPFYIPGQESEPLIVKQIKCIGNDPKFLMEPFNGIIEFDRKIIISPESVIPEYKQLTISNPNSNSDEPLIWNLDKDILENQKVFTVIPEQGTIDSRQTVSLKIGFKPNKPQNFELSIPFYLSNDTEPYTEIKLKGEGAVPKILFDSPEIIMPIVPLNMKSTQIINLYNDGYQNSNINAMMPQEYASLPLSIKFLNGSNIGVNNNKLKIEVSFSSNVPLSFTTRLDFEDDQKRIFSIYISGTTDNSLLTNFVYFINNPHYRFENDPKEGPKVIMENNHEVDISDSQSDAFTYHSNSQDEAYKKYYRQLQTVCKSIKSWFKEYGIANIESYPEDVIGSNGQQIYELIDFLIKNNLDKPDISNISNKNDKIKEQVENYLQLLNFLKEHNAMLNTLRPQFLLSYNDLLKYNSKLNNSNLHSNFYKLSEKKFKVISLTNWILLFNQIIKIFYINRISYKNYKNSFALLNDKPININPEYSIDKNSVYSVQELLMLRWLEVIQKNMTNESVKYLRFDQGLNNCIAIACALETYIQIEMRLVAKLKPRAHTKDDIINNFTKTKAQLIEYGVKDEITESEFTDPNPINFLFIVLHLFKTLPNFLPRSVIEFNCTLQECVIKEIGFSNPANKTIIYSVKSFGHPNFKIQSDTLKLEPRKNNSFAVEYYANTSLPAEGKIIFQNRRNGNSVAGAIVFDLKATVEKRFSIGYHPIKDINLYEVGNAEIEVFNPFDKDVDFKITLESITTAEPIKNKKKTKVKKETKSLGFIPSFFLKQDRIWIRKNSKAKLYLTYLPITFENHKCHLIFLDPKVGEMQYEIEGSPKLPVSLSSFKFTNPIENMSTIDLNIPPKNNLLYSACTKLIDKLRECKMNEHIPTITGIMQNNISSYDVSITPANFFIFNQTFNLFNNRKEVLKNSQIPTNPLVLTPTNKNPVKDLQFKILLKDSNKIDIRLYDMNLTILPKTMKASIEMKTSARVPVIQEIPVSNPSSFDCTIKPSFKAISNGNLFEMTTSPFIVKQKSMETYKIKFYSDWVEKAEGILTMFNQLTNDTFEYFVKAEAEEPLSEDNIKMVTKAKTPCVLKFKIKNPIQNISKFNVDCDIPFSTFDKTLEIGHREEKEFVVNFLPKNGGKFLNAVTFTADSGSYFWYLITLEIEAPASLRVFNIATEVRKPTICKIEIENTMDKEINYEVVIQGDNLSGEQTLVAAPNCKSIYNLIYYPFKIEERKCKIGFISKEEGELWFDINTKAEEAKPIKLSTLKAELGKSKNQTITLKNPLKKRPIHIKTHFNSNSNFYISHREFTIQPKQNFNVQITYMPRELHKNESELIVFSSSDLGDWKYMVFGIGVPPTDFETTTISSSIGKAASKTITFRNPFNNDINVSISLDGDEKNSELFDILVPKNKNVIVSSLSNLQVIIRFIPNVIKNYSSRLVIRLNDSIYWVYPIMGVTEALTLNKEFVLKTKCGNEVEKNLIYEIMGIDEINEDECFNYELSIKHKEVENIKKWLRIKTLKDKIDKPNDDLSYLLNFLPYKPFKTNIDMIISKPSGGRWKVKIQLEALEPDFFEQINIVSQLNVKKIVQFRLFNNDSKQSSNFQAYFTQESDTEFSVEPQNGVLEPAIKEGTMIKISYLPVEYGKLKVGTLIIETESYMWKFLVKGAFQKYHPNKKKRKKTLAKLTEE